MVAPLIVGKLTGNATIGSTVGNTLRGDDTDGANFPDTGSSTGSTITAWANPSRVAWSDDSLVTQTPNVVAALNDYLEVTDFDLSVIHSYAAVTGVLVEIERHRSGGTSGEVQDDTVQLIVAGSKTGDNKSTGANWGTATDTYTSFGGAGVMWGLSLVGSDVTASNFGVAFRCVNTGDRVANVDTVRITVYFDTGSPAVVGTGRFLMLMGCGT